MDVEVGTSGVAGLSALPIWKSAKPPSLLVGRPAGDSFSVWHSPGAGETGRDNRPHRSDRYDHQPVSYRLSEATPLVSVTMICPNLRCGRTVVAADSARGKVVRCGHCQTLFMVPRDIRSTPAPSPTEAPPGDQGKRPGRS